MKKLKVPRPLHRIGYVWVYGGHEWTSPCPKAFETLGGINQ